MSDIPANEIKILIAASGGRCAFPGCAKLLVTESPHGADPVFSGQACHIVAHSRQGPRGKSELNEEERNRHTNLILFCQEHHTLVDKRSMIYSVRVLLAIKAAHEAKQGKEHTGHSSIVKREKERVQSTCMAVTQFPGQIFYAPSQYKRGEEAKVREKRNCEKYTGLTPFFLADDCLYSFCDLRQPFNPFRDVIEPNKAKFQSVDDLLKTQEGHNRVIRLLNMSLRQHLGHKGVTYNAEHHRYHFLQSKEDKQRSQSFKSVTNRTVSRNVVWQPIRKSTGEPRKYWYHLAAGIAFQRVGDHSWVMTLRPERHLTTDGKTLYNPRYVGRRITSLKARMFNDKYLDEVHFWRFFLSGGKPDIHLAYGRQHVMVSAELLAYNVEWPGTEGDKKAFSNIRFDEDLFTFAERRDASEDDLDEDWEKESEEE
jgi:HNH endonuclease